MDNQNLRWEDDVSVQGKENLKIEKVFTISLPINYKVNSYDM